jgi:hypothetical protein
MPKWMAPAAGLGRRIVWAAIALTSSGAAAAPMGFKDSWMATADLSPDWKEAWVNYAFTARDAVGVAALRMRSEDGERERDLVEANYTRLLHRWNLPEAQANVWLFVGLGGIRGNDFDGTRLAFAPGIQLDYETTRIYLAATGRLYRAEGLNHDFASVRVGFSLYEADYDEVQPWIVLEARRMRDLSEKTEITPLLRLVHKRFFAEAGVNNSRQARASLMVVF